MKLENDIEKYLTRQVKQIGGLCYKFTSPGNRGVPDRIVIRQGLVFFAEMKKPNKKPRKDQLKVIQKIKDQGVDVHVIDTKERVDKFIREIVSKGVI